MQFYYKKEHKYYLTKNKIRVFDQLQNVEGLDLRGIS